MTLAKAHRLAVYLGLHLARRRPLLDRTTVYRGKRKGEAYARLRPETRRALEVLGWERALIYKVLALTGLRKAELASLTVRQLDLDHEHLHRPALAGRGRGSRGSSVAPSG